MNTRSASASHIVATVYGVALIFYSLHLFIVAAWLLLRQISLGIHGSYYVAPGAVLCGLGIAFARGHTWPAFPAFLATLVPGLWPLLWGAASNRSTAFLWSKILPLVAPSAFGVATILIVSLSTLSPSNIAPIRLVTVMYAVVLSLNSTFLIWSGVWIFLHVHRHAPFEILYLVPGVAIALLSAFLWLGHAWPAVPPFVASLVPGVWPLLWGQLAAGRTPIVPPWDYILLLNAAAVFGILMVIEIAQKGSVDGPPAAHRHS